MEGNNHDILQVNDTFYRMIKEAEHCASANVSVLSKFDLGRFHEYLNDLESQLNWVQDQPELDLPETHPTVWEYKDPEPQIDVENEGINHLSRLWRLARGEMVNCQSARLSVRLLGFDEGRVRAVIGKSRKFLDDYLSQRAAMDLPESSPQEPVSPPGLTGTGQRT